MLVIGLAGGSGSGKGSVCAIFREFGFEFIDTDALYGKLTAPGGKCIGPLVSEFGKVILNEDGSLNKTTLAKIVFMSENAEEKRKKLDGITHKIILGETRKLLTDYSSKNTFAVLVDAPLLFESGFDRECDIIISVIAEENIRIKRIIQRDKITEEMARNRIASQLSNEFLRENSDYIIVNNGSMEELRGNISSIAEKILKRGIKSE